MSTNAIIPMQDFQETLRNELANMKISEANSAMLQDKFEVFYLQAEEWRNTAENIQVYDISQVEEMKTARVARLAIRDVRVNVEKTRKALKEDSLRYGQAVDKVAKVLTGLIEPIELNLESKEKFKERIEAEQRELIRKEREAIISKYEWNNVTNINLGAMDQDKFDTLLADAEMLFIAKQAQLAKVEEVKQQLAPPVVNEDADDRDLFDNYNKRVVEYAIAQIPLATSLRGKQLARSVQTNLETLKEIIQNWEL
jgi:hypothetical protein